MSDMSMRGYNDRRRTRQSIVRLDVVEKYLALADTMVTCKLTTLGSIGNRGYHGAVLSTEGESQHLLCEITLGGRQTYDDHLPEEVTLDMIFDLASLELAVVIC